MIDDYTGKVNQTAGASNMAYNNNQGNPSTVYNVPGAPKAGYGSLSGGRPGSAPNPATGVPVAPRMPPRNDIVLDPRERTGFGPAPVYPGVGQTPQYPGIMGGYGAPSAPPAPIGIQGRMGQDYWANMRTQRQDRMKRFREQFAARNPGNFMPYFGGGR